MIKVKGVYQMRKFTRIEIVNAYTLVAARSARMAGFLYSYIAFPELAIKRTPLAKEAALETAEMIEALFVGESNVKDKAILAMIPAKGGKLYDYQERWDQEHPELSILDIIVYLREYAGDGPIPETRTEELARYAMGLHKAATRVLEAILDPAEIGFLRTLQRAREI